ncbi:MAG: Uma2 family endonuclease [Chloroflexota bacterium]
MVTQTPAGVTIDDIMNMGDRWFEVVNGTVVYLWGEDGSTSPGFLHNQIAGNIYALLRQHVKENDLGYVCTDGLEYILEIVQGNVQQSRLPDASFISTGNMPEDFDISRPFIGAPDIAVEVVSPGNTAKDIADRVDDFLSAGTREVWVVYPTRRELYLYQKDKQDVVRIFRADDNLQSGVLPALKLKIGDIFDF